MNEPTHNIKEKMLSHFSIPYQATAWSVAKITMCLKRPKLALIFTFISAISQTTYGEARRKVPESRSEIHHVLAFYVIFITARKDDLNRDLHKNCNHFDG